ncbi:hypothetical protein B7767_15605, partial [Streptomyces sp. 13-12-16]
MAVPGALTVRTAPVTSDGGTDDATAVDAGRTRPAGGPPYDDRNFPRLPGAAVAAAPQAPPSR